MKAAPLKLAIDRYRHLRDEAAAAQARVQMERDTALRTLQTLEQYRDEQHERARASQQRLLSTAHLLLRTRFSGKLEEAIALQRERIATIDERITACRDRLLACQQRLKGVESIEDRRTALARHRAERADQFATDEHAALAHERNRRESEEAAARHTAATSGHEDLQ
jgi:flagellar export protein FliJ